MARGEVIRVRNEFYIRSSSARVRSEEHTSELSHEIPSRMPSSA